MKKFLLGLAIMGSASAALAGLPEGNFNYNRVTFYSNGQGAYCRQDNYDAYARELDRWGVREFQSMQNHGDCNPRYGYAQGPFNYRGRSFFASKEGPYCEYRSYNPALREFRGQEARQAFTGANHGYCGG